LEVGRVFGDLRTAPKGDWETNNVVNKTVNITTMEIRTTSKVEKNYRKNNKKN
jgi:hypothetical protein